MMTNKIGVLTTLQADQPCFTQLRNINPRVCQLVSWNPKIWTDDLIVRFAKIGDSSLDVDLMAWFQTRDWNEFLAIRQDMLLRFLEAVEKAGTSLAFPTRDVHLHRETP